MSILDNIKNKNIDMGHIIGSPTLERVSVERFKIICKQCHYQTWFLVTVEDINEEYCLNLMDVLPAVRHITDVSPVYIVKSSVIVGINCDVRSLKESIKFIWTACSLFWSSFRDVCLKIRIGWKAKEIEYRTNNLLWMFVDFSVFLGSFEKFDADKDFNNLDEEERVHSVFHHLLGRPITYEESHQMKKWCCQTFNQVVVRGRLHNPFVRDVYSTNQNICV